MIFPSLIIKVERWKFNKEYGVYVSTLGNFKDRHKRRLPIRIDSKKGYCKVKTERGVPFAHRLVMLTWKPIPDAENLTVDHLNHNKRDNSLQNLEWVTAEENCRRARKDLLVCGEGEAKPLSEDLMRLAKAEIRKEKKLKKERYNEIHPLIKEVKAQGKENCYVISGNTFSSVEDAAEWLKDNLPKSVKSQPGFDVNVIPQDVKTIFKNCHQMGRINRVTKKYGLKFSIMTVEN